MNPSLGLPKGRVAACVIRVLLLGVVLLLPLIAYLATLRVTGNFHTVIDRQLYRSAQPDPERLTRYVADFDIHTVVNLRGAHPKSVWYEAECAAAADAGVVMIDFGMSASEILPPDRSAELMNILRAARKPILVHCKAGSDRTGLVSLLYAYEVAGVDEAVAESQLGAFFGHIGIPYLSPTYAMDETWELREVALGLHAS